MSTRLSAGTRVKARRELHLFFGGDIPDDTVPMGTLGTVLYFPKQEDPDANFDLGIFWDFEQPHKPGSGGTGIEVCVEEVEVVKKP